MSTNRKNLITSRSANGSVIGTCYLLHFQHPYKHARNYLGWTGGDLNARLQAHAAGRGSRLMAVIGDEGIPWRLARVWEGLTRDVERHMKNQRMGPRWCPLCRSEAPARPRVLNDAKPADRVAAGAGITRLRPATLADLAALEQRYPLWTKVARHGREQAAEVAA